MIISHAPDEPLIALAVSPQVKKRGTRRTMALLWWHVSPATPRRPTPAGPRPSTPPATLVAAARRVHVLAWVSPVAECKGLAHYALDSLDLVLYGGSVRMG